MSGVNSQSVELIETDYSLRQAQGTQQSLISVPTALLLIGYGAQDTKRWANFQKLAQRLAERLQQLVIPCPLDQNTDQAGNPILDGIRQGIQQGAVKFVALPLFLSVAEYHDNAIAEAITWASRRWSFLTFHISPPLDLATWADLSQAGIVLLGQNTEDGEVRGDLAKLARLILDSSDVKWVELAFVEGARPDVDRAIRQLVSADVAEVLLLPAYLFDGASGVNLVEIVRDLREVRESASHSQNTAAHLPCTLHNIVDEGEYFLNVLIQKYHDTLQDETLLPVSWEGLRRELIALQADHQPAPNSMAEIGTTQPSDAAQFDDLTERINAILPPRYQNGTEVNAAPMGSADLQFDAEGAVAWDTMWGLDDPESPFCELALAGGPPHRGSLLEPGSPDDCLAEPGKYAAVLAELARGITLVTDLSTANSPVAGWIGLQCTNEEMAIWLLRAIIVENVMVRREDTILYLPAAPHFTLAGEVKNVVTVVAKTVHYWVEHSALQFPM